MWVLLRVGRSVDELEAQAGEQRGWATVWHRHWRSAQRTQETLVSISRHEKHSLKTNNLSNTRAGGNIPQSGAEKLWQLIH